MAERTHDVILVKLGGSLITDKAGVANVRSRRLARLSAEIASALPDAGAGLILGHGSGSFGHVAATRHGFGDPGVRATPSGVAAVQQAAADLHALVTRALCRAGVPAWSMAPSGFLVSGAGRPQTVALAPLLRALEIGMVPVTHGDVVMDRESGASICSTETVLLTLGRRLRRRGIRIRRAYWFGDTDGVFDGDGRTVPRVTLAELPALRRHVGGSGATDVTGGMRHRLETAGAFARLGVDSWVLDGTRRGALAAALAGEPHGGTHFVARPAK